MTHFAFYELALFIKNRLHLFLHYMLEFEVKLTIFTRVYPCPLLGLCVCMCVCVLEKKLPRAYQCAPELCDLVVLVSRQKL